MPSSSVCLVRAFYGFKDRFYNIEEPPGIGKILILNLPSNAEVNHIALTAAVSKCFMESPKSIHSKGRKY